MFLHIILFVLHSIVFQASLLYSLDNEATVQHAAKTRNDVVAVSVSTALVAASLQFGVLRGRLVHGNQPTSK